MRRTPKSIPASELQQESGAQDLVRSEKMKPYLELLKAHIGGQDTAPYLAALAELPLEERYVWRVISALKWAFCDLETENVLADLETLSEDDLKLVSEPLAIRAIQFSLLPRHFSDKKARSKSCCGTQGFSNNPTTDNRAATGQDHLREAGYGD
jgi:hypothetical protein